MMAEGPREIFLVLHCLLEVAIERLGSLRELPTVRLFIISFKYVTVHFGRGAFEVGSSWPPWHSASGVASATSSTASATATLSSACLG